MRTKKILAALICLTVFAAPVVAQDSPEPYFDFDFNETSSPAIDYSGNNRDGDWQGSIESVQGVDFGGDGLAYSMDQEFESVNLDVSSGTTPPTEQQSFSAWVKPDSQPSSGNFMTILDNLDAGFNDGSLLRYSSDGLELLFYDSGNGAVYATGNLDAGAWNHVAYTFDQGGFVLYVNGSQVDSGSTGFNEISNDGSSSEAITIGASETNSDASTDGDQFLGDIDEPILYNNASLTSDQVNNLYQTNTLEADIFTDISPADGANRGFENINFSHTITAPEGGANITGITLYYPNGTKFGDFDDSVDLTEGETYNHSEIINFNASSMPEGAWQWTATASDFDTGDLYTSGNRTLNIDGDNADVNFTLNNPMNNTGFNNGETVDFNASVTAPEGVTLEDAQIQYFTDTGQSGTIAQQQNVADNTVTLTGSETFNENANYTWYATALPEGAGTYQDSSESYFTVSEPDYNITFANFEPADQSTYTEGDTINFSVDVTSDYGQQHDIEGIYDGQIEEVCTHPGDGSTVTCEYSVTENTPGTYNYRFSAITSSPSGTFLNDTENRELTVEQYPVTATFTNFQPADNQTFEFGEQINISVDVKADAQQSIDVEGIVDGNIKEVFTHPGDNSTQSYEFTVSYDQNMTDVGYRFSAITSSPNGSFINDTEQRTFDVIDYDEPLDTGGIASGIGAKIAAFIANIFSGFFDGIENNVSEANQTLVAAMLAIIIAVITAAVTRSSIIGMGAMMLTVLGFVVNGWLPSWIGFVFITLTAAVLALIAGRVVGGG